MVLVAAGYAVLAGLSGAAPGLVQADLGAECGGCLRDMFRAPHARATVFVLVLGFLVFTASFDFGFGSLVWVYASESFPTALRSRGQR
jgi:hypothetical protein